MSSESIADRLGRLIEETGPIAVSTYLEQALYGPDGFYMAGGHAGRRGDFLTAPEVGPLFGAVIARALDAWWGELGRPTPFTVLEWGAGPGTLARGVLAAKPDVLLTGALRWVMIERSAAQRDLQPTHDQVESLAPEDAPVVEAGIVLANELLDNLVFDIFERGESGWAEIRIDRVDGRFIERRGAEADVEDLSHAAQGDVPVGARVPRQLAAREWLNAARESVGRGRVVVFDYGGTTAELSTRGGAWLRTHARHEGGADWLAAPGSCDITTDVDLDQLQLEHRADRDERQADWLTRFGVDGLVDEGRAIWEASAGVGDLSALKARSRIREAEALTDPRGMGSFRVLEWEVGPTWPSSTK